MKSSVANEVAMKASLVVSRYSGSFLAIIWAVDGESIGSVNRMCRCFGFCHICSYSFLFL